MLVRASFLLLVGLTTVCGRGQKGRDGFETLFAHRTVGQPWPMPQSISTSVERLAVHADSFSFLLNETSTACDLIENAFDRYYKLIFTPGTYLEEVLKQPSTNNKLNKTNIPRERNHLQDKSLLKRLEVRIEGKCEQWPRLESNESCKIDEKNNPHPYTLCLVFRCTDD